MNKNLAAHVPFFEQWSSKHLSKSPDPGAFVYLGEAHGSYLEWLYANDIDAVQPTYFQWLKIARACNLTPVQKTNEPNKHRLILRGWKLYQ